MGKARIVNTALFLAIIRYGMLAGALYDAAFAIPILAAPDFLAGRLGLPMPDQQIHLRFLGIFLLVTSLFYMMPVLYPGKYLGNVAVAVLGRAMGAAFLMAAGKYRRRLVPPRVATMFSGPTDR